MSRYLIERIEAAPNIELMFNTEVVAVEGSDARSNGLRWRSRFAPENIHTLDIAISSVRTALIPRPAGSRAAASRSTAGGFCDGRTVRADHRPSGPPLETSVPGVFRSGDVRSGSVKRVRRRDREGAQVVAALHGYLPMPMKPAL